MKKADGKKIKYIFCISTGRCGTEYLANLFHCAENCEVFHELAPIGNGKVMSEYLRGNNREMVKLTEQKITTINENTANGNVHIDTNHCFIKGFGWIIPSYIPQDQIGVVILTRNKHKVAQSLLRIGCTPLSKVGRKWMNTPLVKTPFLKPPNRYGLSSKLTYWLFLGLKQFFRGKIVYTFFGLKKPKTPKVIIDYERDCCSWYIEEIAEQAKAYRSKYKNISFYEVGLEELNSLSKVQDMLEFFGLDEKESLIRNVGKAANLKLQVQRPANSYYGD